ncbi:methyl-accepting chemotaxis protein [Pararhodospirillum photometricum]|uniref:Methyl-accepting chemotaxis protein, putative n=1 Tax=Pararhodospirillum photometricum DSM 122 TaxID=1150469 RepID=H6SJ57_PARPM|nr:methyl-accepting chemotaxis protein [Pararhodospirillum photometricum]CCG08022.1 Methyl-accepting chemotaxis protein, putative [Pararhodospirillum photometricum DSM 122]
MPPALSWIIGCTMLKNLPIASRLLVIVALAVVGMVLMGGAGLTLVRNSLFDERENMTRVVVDASVSLIASLHERARSGEMSEEEAKIRAVKQIKAVRFGANDYVFIYDSTGTVIFLPDEKMIGQNRIDLKDSHGTPLIRNIVTIGMAGGGRTTYSYPKAGGTKPLPKISYVKPYPAWDWVVGTGVYVDDIDDAFFRHLGLMSLVGAGTLLLTLGGAFLIGRGITGPLGHVTGAMERLAGGDLSIQIAETDRKDEIGRLARALETFRTNAREIERLKREQEESRERAESQRRAAMGALADRFQSSVAAIVGAVTDGAQRMREAASGLVRVAETTGDQSAHVAASSEQASANVQTVAAATEELAASIAEIARQITQANTIAGKASEDMVQAQGIMSGLTEAARRIGDVMDLISGIAAQTNLLALNATIEAARAGDAGKGFAVVAGEVKTLATQTAHATGDISAQIGAIREASASAASAIEAIGTTLRDINSTSSAIASAVEEQGATTRDISRNVDQAAQGTLQVSQTISNVRDNTWATRQAAEDLRSASETLFEQIVRLRDEVDGFLSHVRAP